MSKHPKHVEIQTQLLELKKYVQAGDNVRASIILEQALINFMRFIAEDRDTRICCQNWISELANEFVGCSFIPVTRSP